MFEYHEIQKEKEYGIAQSPNESLPFTLSI